MVKKTDFFILEYEMYTYYSYTMDTTYLAIVKTAMESSFVIGYDDRNVYEPTLDSRTGIITCKYLHPTDPDTTYIISIIGENFIVAILEHEY